MKIAFALALLLGGIEPLLAVSLSFRPLPMRFGDMSRTVRPCAKDPTVIKQGERYLLYYTLPPMDDETRKTKGLQTPSQRLWSCAVAESRDLVTWRRIGDLMIRRKDGRPAGSAGAPCVRKLDGKIVLFYQHWTPAITNNAIWYATSPDGLRFTNCFDEPVFVPKNKWSKPKAIDAEVYRVGDDLVLLYASRDAQTGKRQMLGMAKAPYGSDYSSSRWTELSQDRPLLEPVMPWEQNCIEAPSVEKIGKTWYLFYAGSFNNKRQQIGLATSTDGFHFKRFGPDGLVFPCGCAGSWNSCESGHPGIFRDDDGRLYLFYQGKSIMPGCAAGYELSCAEVIGL